MKNTMKKSPSKSRILLVLPQKRTQAMAKQANVTIEVSPRINIAKVAEAIVEARANEGQHRVADTVRAIEARDSVAARVKPKIKLQLPEKEALGKAVMEFQKVRLYLWNIPAIVEGKVETKRSGSRMQVAGTGRIIRSLVSQN